MLNLISDIYYLVGFKLSNRLLVKTCSGYRPPSRYLKSRRRIAGKVWASKVLLSGI